MQKCNICKENCFNKILESNNDFFKEENHRTIQFKKGETLVKQGSFVTHIIFLTKGIVKIVMEGTNGKNIISSFVSAPKSVLKY